MIFPAHQKSIGCVVAPAEGRVRLCVETLMPLSDVVCGVASLAQDFGQEVIREIDSSGHAPVHPGRRVVSVQRCQLHADR